jgi:hypothetical protein
MSKAAPGNRHLALALVSAALLAFQVVLLQLLATSQWHHFAYFVISVAMLGFGAAGSLLSLARDWLLVRQNQLLPLLLCACAVTLVAPLGVAQLLFGGFDSFLLFVDAGEALRLAAVAFLLMLPFAFGALAIGLVFVAETERIGSYYFANLLGSGLGSILGLAGLAWLLPQRLPPLFALLVLAAGALLLRQQRRFVQGALLGGLLLTGFVIFQAPSPVLSQYKDLRRALELPAAETLVQRAAATGQVQVVQSPALRNAAGISLNWRGEVPSSPVVFVNGDTFGALPTGPESNKLRDAATFGLPYALRSPHKVLVLNAATGLDVVQALGNGAAFVRAVEPQGAVTATLRDIDPHSFGAMLNDSRTDWQTMAARTWLARDRDNYDLIIMPILGSLGGSAGLFALHQQPLLTREALKHAWLRLQPQGMLAMTIWLDYPPRAPLRLLATLIETLHDEGISHPAERIIAVRGWGTLTFCVLRVQPSEAQFAGARQFASRWGFDPILLPDLGQHEPRRQQGPPDELLPELFSTLLGPERSKLYSDYPFRIAPVTDDRPFFSQFLRWGRLPELVSLYGQRTMPFLEIGMLVAALAAVVLSLLATLLILLPLLRLPGGEGRWTTLLYFGGLGIGYMWVELALIHHFVFYLGQPVYAAALVVGVLLVGSGIGSALSVRLDGRRTDRWAAYVACSVALSALLLGPLLQGTLQFPLATRVSVAVLLLTPLAMLMGTPFPLGLRRLGQLRPREVPWAWGINGCLSVVSAALATLVAVEIGFSILLLLAAVAYLLPATARLGTPS